MVRRWTSSKSKHPMMPNLWLMHSSLLVSPQSRSNDTKHMSSSMKIRKHLRSVKEQAISDSLVSSLDIRLS